MIIATLLAPHERLALGGLLGPGAELLHCPDPVALLAALRAGRAGGVVVSVEAADRSGCPPLAPYCGRVPIAGVVLGSVVQSGAEALHRAGVRTFIDVGPHALHSGPAALQRMFAPPPEDRPTYRDHCVRALRRDLGLRLTAGLSRWLDAVWSSERWTTRDVCDRCGVREQSVGTRFGRAGLPSSGAYVYRARLALMAHAIATGTTAKPSAYAVAAAWGFGSGYTLADHLRRRVDLTFPQWRARARSEEPDAELDRFRGDLWLPHLVTLHTFDPFPYVTPPMREVAYDD